MNLVRKQRISFFLENCNIGGLRFLGERCSIYGRIFWIIILIISITGIIKISILTYERFFTDIVSIGINTDYLHWTNTFLAVSVCLRQGSVINLFTPKFADDNLQMDTKYKRTIYDIIFFSSSDVNRVLTGPCKGRNETCDADLNSIRKEFVPINCNDFMTNVEFNDKKFKRCDEIFKYHLTLLGPCFIANGLIDYDLDATKLPLKFNREINYNPMLSFQTLKNVHYDYKLFVHSPEDFPSYNGFEAEYKRSNRYRFSIIEMENHPDVMNFSTIEERRCRFPNEKLSPDDIFHYSFTTCLQKKQIEMELKMCNCTLPLAPEIYEDKYCFIRQYACIRKAFRIFNSFSFDQLCVKSCVQIEYKLVSDEEYIVDDLPTYYKQEIMITNTPTMRYTRYVARTGLDLVVAIGGVAGLFFGASIMNIFEIIYLFFIRKF